MQEKIHQELRDKHTPCWKFPDPWRVATKVRSITGEWNLTMCLPCSYARP